DAYAEYNQARLNAGSVHDSVMAVIDMLAVEELMEDNLDNASEVGVMSATKNLMALLDGRESNCTEVLAESFTLLRAYPNPFNSTVKIEFNLEADAKTRVSIHDITGREIDLLVDEMKFAGNHGISWTAKGVPTGIYFCRVEAGNKFATQKLTLIR
ncbi:MAG: T9SS type A sorting domain-containing protein, partial [Calditrichaeota bacterium]|nr:T9SS type A sorting domain-containing protein [Calditrichota bacterium]